MTEEKLNILVVYIPPELLEKLAELSSKCGISVENLASLMIAKGLENDS